MTEESKTCEQCKEEYVPIKSWQKFCSSRCRDDFWIDQRKGKKEFLDMVAQGEAVVLSKAEYEALTRGS